MSAANEAVNKIWNKAADGVDVITDKWEKITEDKSAVALAEEDAAHDRDDTQRDEEDTDQEYYTPMAEDRVVDGGKVILGENHLAEKEADDGAGSADNAASCDAGESDAQGV